MKKSDVKTIDINAKEWFDRVNGNSYFAGTVTVNYGMPDQKEFIMPFQYGYGSQYEYEALITLKNEGLIPEISFHELWERGVVVRRHKQTGCKKRELMAYLID